MHDNGASQLAEPECVGKVGRVSEVDNHIHRAFGEEEGN